MKFAAFTEDTIWSVEADEASARSEGEATMRDLGEDARIKDLRIAPIDEALVSALEDAEKTGGEVLFELVDGELVEMEEMDS